MASLNQFYTHTVRKAEGQHRVFAEPSFLTSQSFFGGINTKTNSRDEPQAGGFDIFSKLDDGAPPCDQF